MLKKKITLVWPIYPAINDYVYPQTPSIAMQYFSKILSANGFEVVVIDFDMVLSREEIRNYSDKTTEKIITMIEKTDPDILGVGSYTVTMPIVSELTRTFKARNPDVPIVLGGTNPTLFPDDTLNLLPHVDYLVRGEGEYTFLELVQKLSTSKSVGDVRGISYKSDGKIVHTPNRPFIQDLGKLPLIDLEHFIIKNKFMYTMMWDRGCIANCSFCEIRAIWGLPRLFPPRYIVNLIKHIRNLYPNVTFVYNADNIFSNINWIKKVAELIHSELPDFRWGGCGALLPITKELIDFLDKRGMRSLFIGVESIIPESLIFFNKTKDPSSYIQKIHKVLEIIENSNIWADLAFMSGAPNETKENILNLKEFMMKINNKYSRMRSTWQRLILPPGTPIWCQYLEGKIKIQKLPPKIRDEWIPKISQKYDHLPWMSPYSYVIENNTMPLNELMDLFIELDRDIGFMRKTKKLSYLLG